MSTYQNFIFKDYEFHPNSGELYLYYSLDGLVEFIESYHFDFEFDVFDPGTLDRACQSLFYMAGVSYYKAYLPKVIAIDKGQLDSAMADFLNKTYQKGLAEFFYINKLDPKTPISFQPNISSLPPLTEGHSDGLLVGIGGGKDSLVSVELMKQGGYAPATWSVGHRQQLEPLVEHLGTNHYWVERKWDRKLLEHNSAGALNGHVPISAILSCVGTIVAILTGKKDVVVSNEQSASEPSLNYRGVEINHQYSKSLEYERDYQQYLEHTLGNRTRYYSYLRPFSEVYIAELFSKIGFSKYRDLFSSCNQAFTHTSSHIFWCGKCPKCAFVFLALTPFVKRDELESIWHKNLLLDPNLEPTYRQLLGITGNKPLDCVGEVKESRAAMRLAQEIYPELDKYKFDIPSNYDYRSWGEHTMPSNTFEDLRRLVKQLD